MAATAPGFLSIDSMTGNKGSQALGFGGRQGSIPFNMQMPEAPGYHGLNQGNDVIAKQLQSQFDPNTQGLEAIRSRALGTGPSPWAQEALKQQGLEESGLKNAAQRQGATAGATARSQLASKFGLSQAAQERLATQGQRDEMKGLQNVSFQGAGARAGIGAQDEATRNQMLMQLPGQENALAQGQAQSQQFNIRNSIEENQRENEAKYGRYNDQMKNYGAASTANAMANSGGGGKK